MALPMRTERGPGRGAARPALVALLSLGLLAGCGHRATTTGWTGARAGGSGGPGSASDPWGPYIHEASGRFHVPEQWIRAVMHQESGGHQYLNGRPTTSWAGAAGLMQVMPGTYAELAARYGLGPDPYDPHDNIMAGTAYIRQLYHKYGSPGFLAAYNAGPGRMDAYVARGSSLPTETVNYVASISPNLGSRAAEAAAVGAIASAAEP
ncbi:lytic transglycosylase domain-containing protein, partial [Acidisphaera rubrifaciens]|uniref:lytic transglycosylase domain-containing protein n=1 Tax=Acidisphaera rubrifaciens TaxID=50715 RepID=UPI000A715243